jgi:hypothetical protein
VEEEISKLEATITGHSLAKRHSPRWLAVKLLEEDSEIIKKFEEVKVG